MAKKRILLEELEGVEGSGIGGRIQKNDLIKYIEGRGIDTANIPSQQNIGSSEAKLKIQA